MTTMQEWQTAHCQDRRYTMADMEAYAAQRLAEYKKRRTHATPKFTRIEVDDIRARHAAGDNYKRVYMTYRMSEVTFIKIVKHRGAYK